MSEVITTGTDVIRQMLRVLNKKMNLAILARDLGISSDALQAFIDGQRSLPIPVLQGLTKKLWGHAVYDPELDRLRPARQEPAKPLWCAAEPDDPVADLHRRSCTRRAATRQR